jgi:hypothetical protein
MTGFGAQRIVFRSRKPCSQARQDVVGDAERGAPLPEPPAGNGGERAVVQQLDIVGDFRRIEIASRSSDFRTSSVPPARSGRCKTSTTVRSTAVTRTVTPCRSMVTVR